HDDDDDDGPPKKKAVSKEGRDDYDEPTTDEERRAAFMIYVAAVFPCFIGLGLFGGIVWWFLKKGESKFVDHHGKELLNLMITGFLIGLILSPFFFIGGVCAGILGDSGWISGGSAFLTVLLYLGLGGLFLFATTVGLLYALIFLVAMFRAKGGVWY